MNHFSYTGRNAAGPVSGELDAASAQSVAEVLRSRGVTPLKIAAQRSTPPTASPTGAHNANRTSASTTASALPSPSTPSAASAPQPAWWQPKVQPVDLLLFSRQLHTLLKAGVPILRALAGLQDSAVSVRMKHTLSEVRQSLSSGIDLSTSMAQQSRVFDGFYVALVRVGEMTGRLDEVFLRLFHHIEFEIFMRQQVKSALRYPAFVLAAMMAAIAVINVMVIPAFATVFKSFNAELPWATRLLMSTSNFTLQYGWLLVLLSALGGWAWFAWRKTPAGRLRGDRWTLHIPLAGRIVHKAMLARFARSFTLSLKSGVPIEQALSVVAHTVDNTHIAQKIEGMRASVERGESILRAAAATGVFTPIVLQMIAVGEETGAVDELMDQVAELYTNDVQYELKTLGQQIEPILIVFLGVVVLVLALGVFLPVWDLGRVALK